MSKTTKKKQPVRKRSHFDLYLCGFIFLVVLIILVIGLINKFQNKEYTVEAKLETTYKITITE